MLHLTMTQGVLAVIAGVMVGFSLGLIGGGGSILAVPLLLYVVGIHDPHVVIGTTAFAVAVNAYINLYPHWKAGNVKWKAAVGFALPGVGAAFLGSTLGKMLNGKDLLFLFAVMMLVVAVVMLRPRRDNGERDFVWSNSMYRRVVPAGLLVGFVSGFFGIGGGFLIVPGLLFATGMPMIYAIGSSLFSVGTFGITTAVNYAFSGLVDWVVVLAYLFGGVLGGMFGTTLANRLSQYKRALNYLFSGIVVVVALYMMDLNLSVIHLHV